MRIDEIITEGVNEKTRQKKLKNRDARQAKNAADAKRADLDKQLARQRHAARLKASEVAPKPEPETPPSGPYAEIYAQQQSREDSEYGYYFRFQVDNEGKLWGYWAKSKLQTLDDVKRYDQYKDLSKLNAPLLVKEFDELGKKLGYIHIIFDKNLLKSFKYPAINLTLDALNKNQEQTKNDDIPWGHTYDRSSGEVVPHVAWEEV